MKKLICLLALFFFPSINLINAQDRSFKEISLKLDKKIKLSDYDIFRPNLLSTNYKGDVVFFDYVKFQLVYYNIHDSKFKFIGGGKGRGPKEFNMIMDLKIDENGEVTLADRDKIKIIKWNLEGEYLGEFKTKEKFIRPSRIAVCGSGDYIYILSSQYSPRGFIHYLNLSGQESNKSFLSIESPDKRFPFFTDGELNCDQENNLYYASRYVNSIKKFDPSGSIIFDIPVYGFEKNVTIMEKNGRMYTPAEDVRRASGDIYRIEDNLYVGFSDSKYSKLKLIDVYNPENGEYKYSIDVPFKFNEFAISNKNIFYISEDSEGEIYLLIYTYDRNKL